VGRIQFIERAVSPQRAISIEILPATEPAEGKSIVISRAPTGRRGTIGMKLRLRPPILKPQATAHSLRFGSILPALQQAMT
jgi:hypothetical protein